MLYSFKFNGHFPVGAVGLVEAETPGHAKEYAENILAERGLPQELYQYVFKVVNLIEGDVLVLLDGNY